METKVMETVKALKGRSLMEPFDFSVEELEALIERKFDLPDE